MITGVLDANAVIGLAKGAVFQLLASLYSPLYVPSSVTQEVVGQGQGRAGVAELATALGGWVTEVTPSPQQVRPFGTTLRSRADREVLAVARLKAVDHILSNDGRLIQEARRWGMTCVELPEVVVLLKRRGLIPVVKPVLDRMRQEGFGIANVVYLDALHMAGE
jgi:uncharacterized protein